MTLWPIKANITKQAKKQKLYQKAPQVYKAPAPLLGRQNGQERPGFEKVVKIFIVNTRQHK